MSLFFIALADTDDRSLTSSQADTILLTTPPATASNVTILGVQESSPYRQGEAESTLNILKVDLSKYSAMDLEASPPEQSLEKHTQEQDIEMADPQNIKGTVQPGDNMKSATRDGLNDRISSSASNQARPTPSYSLHHHDHISRGKSRSGHHGVGLVLIGKARNDAELYQQMRRRSRVVASVCERKLSKSWSREESIIDDSELLEGSER